MLTFSDEEKRICSIVEKSLQDFPLYLQNYDIFVVIHERGTSIGYRTVKNLAPTNSTNFDVQLVDDKCYVLWINISPEKRGKGDGKALYNCIEHFYRELGYTQINLNPSGPGKDTFWKRLGFEEETKMNFIKKLSK